MVYPRLQNIFIYLCYYARQHLIARIPNSHTLLLATILIKSAGPAQCYTYNIVFENAMYYGSEHIQHDRRTGCMATMLKTHSINTIL